jgi:hypothetical protein
MDRFVKRIPIAPREVRARAAPAPPQRQSRIEDLAGVANITSVCALRDELQAVFSEGADAGTIMRALRDAEGLHIALEVLELTEIGKAVHKFVRHDDGGIRELALAIEARWMKVAADGFETRKRRERKGLLEPQRGVGAGAAAGGGRVAAQRVPPAGGGGVPPGRGSAAEEARRLRAEAEEVEAAALQGYASRLAAGGQKRLREEGGGVGSSGGVGSGRAGSASPAAAAAAAAPPPLPPPPPPQQGLSTAAAAFFAPRGSKPPPPPPAPALAPPPLAAPQQQAGKLSLFELG